MSQLVENEGGELDSQRDVLWSSLFYKRGVQVKKPWSSQDPNCVMIVFQRNNLSMVETVGHFGVVSFPDES